MWLPNCYTDAKFERVDCIEMEGRGGGKLALAPNLLRPHNSARRIGEPGKYKMKQIPKMDILYLRYSRKKQKNNGVGDISSLFQRHCQNNQTPQRP